MITNYIPDTCKYSVNNLKKVVHIFSSSSNVIHIDNGEAYATSGITDLQTISATSVTFEENTSYDDRFKFQKTVTVTCDGFLKLDSLNEKYYVVLEDENKVKWLVNVDFPSLVTYTYTLTDGTDETVFTFNALSNFPSLKLNSNINNYIQCKQYNHTKVNELKMLEKKYANINASSSIIYGYSNQVYKTVKPNEGSIKLEETFDGTNVTTNIQFNINFDDYQSSWHYNLLEYPDNKYVAVIDHLASGFEMGLVPSYNVQGSHEINQSDIVTIKLVGTSQRGSEWAEKWTEVTVAPVYEWKLTDEWVCSPIEYRWVTVPDAYECSGTTKMTQEKKQFSIDGEHWSDTIPLETRPALPVIEEYSQDCGYVPLVRWAVVSEGYLCSGTTKMTEEKKQISYDSGTTWVDVVPLETRAALPVIEYHSEDCGYVPIYDKKFQLTLKDSSTVTAACDSTSTITSSEISEIYNYRRNARSVIIGECVTTIGGSAFSGCTYITAATIPDSITSIKGGAFAHCTSLTNVTIPSGVTEIGASAFHYCGALESVNIPSGVTEIGTNTFGQCGRLRSIIIPDSVTIIDNWAFFICDALRTCIIGSGVTSIGKEAFYQCDSISSITIPDSVTRIGQSAFYGCSGATSLTIGSGIKGIESEAFSYCRALSNITIKATTPPTLVRTGSGVFYYTNNCPIYVPSASVDSYKSALGWSNYADRIQAIP